uniref:Uncharacterized protein n=1 Tax=Anguilla anguilla TaxID=7936 RepID=A0A0E9XG90_ANGAN
MISPQKDSCVTSCCHYHSIRKKAKRFLRLKMSCNIPYMKCKYWYSVSDILT